MKNPSFQKTSTKQKGFTLLELMIAMTILGLISYSVYQISKQIFDGRDKLEAEADFYNSVRGAFDVLSRDILHIYTPQAAAMPYGIGEAHKSGQPLTPGPGTLTLFSGFFDPGRPLEFWGSYLNSFGVRPSRLQGTGDKLQFVANSHVRLFKDALESEFARFTYALEDDKLLSKPGLKTLVKYEDPDVFDESGKREERKVRTPLLGNIKLFQLSYLDGEQDQWVERWDTQSQMTFNIFPALIRVTIEAVPPAPIPEEATLVVSQVYRVELAL